MEAFRQSITQYQQIFASMTSRQRVLTIAAPLIVLVALGSLVLNQDSTELEPIAWGTSFDAESIARAEQTLRSAGLGEFRRERNQLLAPTDKLELYNAVLLKDGELPQDATTEWERQFDKANPLLSTSGEREELRDIALRKELARVIRAVPEIDTASVIWARGKKSFKWTAQPKVTATVFVMPKPGVSLSTTLIRSLQSVVAGVVSDLKSDDVVVFDQARGRHVGSGTSDWFDDDLMEYMERFEEIQEDKLSQSLSHIQGIRITAVVDVDQLRRLIDAGESTKREEVELERDEQSFVPRVRGPNQMSVLQRQRVIQPVSNRPVQSALFQLSNQPQEVVAASPQQIANDLNDRINLEMTREQLALAMPKALRVSVAVPDDHYRAIALKHGMITHSDREFDFSSIENRELQRVKETVATLLPIGTPSEAVNISTYSMIASDAKNMVVVPDDEEDFIGRWGGLVGLMILALVMALFWRRDASIDNSTIARHAAGAVNVSDDSVTKSNRELIEETIRNNPEAAARLIGQWIQSADDHA